MLDVAVDEAGLRLDRWFKRHYPELGHGRLERLLRTGQVRLDGKRVKAGDRIEAGQAVRVPPLDQTNSSDTAASANSERGNGERVLSRSDVDSIRARILYRDDDVMVINKPAGLAVQGGTNTSHHLDGLLDALRFDAVERPKLVHRLDKDTSGVLVLARSTHAASKLTACFRGRDARKLYCAITVGVAQPEGGHIDLALAKESGPRGERVATAGEAGLKATTLYQVMDTIGDKAAYVHLSPLTGRTHQLRVHMLALKTPILGDGKYGGAGAFLSGMETAKQLHLHARRIVMPHPRSGEIDVVAPLPPHMIETCGLLGFEPKSLALGFPGDDIQA